MNNRFSIRRFNEFLWCEVRLNMRKYLLGALAIAACATLSFLAANGLWHNDALNDMLGVNGFEYPHYLLFAAGAPSALAGILCLTIISKLFSSFHRDGSGSFAMMLPATLSEKFLAIFKLSILVQLFASIVIEVVFVTFCLIEIGEIHFSVTTSFPAGLNSSLNHTTIWLAFALFQSTFFLAGVLFKSNAFMKCTGIYAALLFLTTFGGLVLSFSNHSPLIMGVDLGSKWGTVTLHTFYIVATIAVYIISWLRFKRMQIKK